ncbi:MAG: GMC family oxidoreductase [Pseudobacteriovorax sp.]|nr:GMC family oxidoreductase [Pseudobacteriovorax sp.]
MKKHVSRRALLKTAAASSLAVCGVKSNSELSAGSNLKNQYDFIIVGSGAGGGPLACNLAKAGFEVLLLEAGSRDSGERPNRDIPLFHSIASEDEALSWAFYTNHYQNPENQEKERKHYQPGEAQWTAGGGVYYPRGSTLGGSTAVNAMIAVLPHKEDFNHIATITGDESWRSFGRRGLFGSGRQGMIDKYFPRVQ